MAWSIEDYLHDSGLALSNGTAYKKRRHYIDKGEIDPISMGGVAVISEGTYSPKGTPKSLDIKYWTIQPDGRKELQNLINIEMESHNGSSKFNYKSVYVLGREVNLNDPQNIENVIEAVRRIHVSLRDKTGMAPHIARIFEDCMLEEVIGETLPLPGFDLDQRIKFNSSLNFNMKARGAKQRPQLDIPLEAFLPLAGIRKNTVDTDHSYMRKEFLKARSFMPRSKKRFDFESRLYKATLKKKSQKLKITTTPISETPSSNDNQRVLASAQWKIERAGKKRGFTEDTARLKEISLIDKNVLRQGFRDAMAALGVINKTHVDMLNQDYPSTLDHMATYGLSDSVNSSSPPAPKEGRAILTSEGGNNIKEIVPGVGTDIGGNCKTFETQYEDIKTGEQQKCGVILDWGSHIIKQASNWNAAHPDLVEKLKYCKDAFITHHHLDHLDGIIPYIVRGLLSKEHTLHITPEVYEMLHDKLVKWGVKADDPRRPQINLLKDASVIDIKDEDGIERLSVLYGVDAVPHSAKDTPFTAYARMGKKILGSYQYLGDARYEERHFEIHDSKYWDQVSMMTKHCPDAHQYMVAQNRKAPELRAKAKAYLEGLYRYNKTINPNASRITQKLIQKTVDEWHFIPTYAELDATSMNREGRGADERVVEDNLTHIMTNWLSDKHVAIGRIGTADSRRETELCAANRAQRKVTAFGAAIELHYRIANKHGVNPYIVERPQEGKYTGIDDFLKWHANQNDITPTEFKGRTSVAVKDWFEHGQAGTIMAIMSGSQGNAIEFESMLYKLSEGRSYLDADPKTSSTARPANLKDWAVIMSQSAIPGNAKDQKTLIKRLAARGMPVIEAFDDNLRVHNPGKLKQHILDDLIATGRLHSGCEKDVVEADGSILVQGMSIHASGHGRKEDNRLWIRNKITAKQIGLHHTDSWEAIQAGYDLIEEEGRQHPGNIFENAVETQVSLESVKEIGRKNSSLIMTREVSEPGKQWNKSMESARVINDDYAPHHNLGLSGKTGGAREIHFGTEDEDAVRKREAQNVIKVQFNYSQGAHSKPGRAYQGLKPMEEQNLPIWDPNHPDLDLIK